MSVAGMRPRLVAVWGLLLLLIAVIAAIEIRDRSGDPTANEHATYDARALLPVSIDEIGSIEIAYGGALHKFERDAAGAWFYHGVHSPTQGAHAHQPDPMLAKRIETALTGFGRTRTERQFPLDKGVQEFGINNPQMVVLVYLPNDLKPRAQYAVGDVAPDKVSRYVLGVGSSAVVTIPNYQIENLINLIKEASAQSAAAVGKR